MSDPQYDRHVSVDTSMFDAALEVTVWDNLSADKRRLIRIPVEDVPAFMDAVVRNGTRSLTTAAKRIEVGHCETCGNTGLVDVEKHGRTSNEYCPDCRDRWPTEAFANAPHIGYRGEA